MGDTTAFPELVALIYECVLHPERWAEVLVGIQREVGAMSSYLLIHGTNPRARDLSVLVERNVDTRMRLAYDQHYIRLNPLLPYLGSAGSGEVYSCRHLVTQPEYLKSDFYQEWAKPQKWFDYAGVTLLRQDHVSAAIGFTRGGQGNVFDDVSLDLLRHLAPHLTRAAQIQNLLELERQSRRDLACLIEATRCGVLIVDEEARVIEANPAAEALLARQEGLRCRERRLDAGGVTSALQASVRAACSGNRSHGSATVRVNRGPGRRVLVLHVMPLAGPPQAPILGLVPARAAVFLVDPEDAPVGSLAIFAETYQLTTAEREVLERLAAGASTADIAEALDIGMPTVRTHLHRLFDKTGTRRQAELLTLLLGSGLPFRTR